MVNSTNGRTDNNSASQTIRRCRGPEDDLAVGESATAGIELCGSRVSSSASTCRRAIGQGTQHRPLRRLGRRRPVRPLRRPSRDHTDTGYRCNSLELGHQTKSCQMAPTRQWAPITSAVLAFSSSFGPSTLDDYGWEARPVEDFDIELVFLEQRHFVAGRHRRGRPPMRWESVMVTRKSTTIDFLHDDPVARKPCVSRVSRCVSRRKSTTYRRSGSPSIQHRRSG